MSRMATSIFDSSSCGSESSSARRYSKNSYGWWMSRRMTTMGSGNGGAELRFRDDVIDHVAQILSLRVSRELAIGARVTFHDFAGIVDLFTRTELVDDVIDEFQQLI